MSSWAPLLLLAGPLVLVALILIIVFTMVRRAIDRAAAGLIPEGVVLDSGPVTVTTRFRDFRGPGIARSGGLRRVPGRIVLTHQRLHILARPQRYGIIERADLARFTVGTSDGKLQMQTSDPPGASGFVDYRVALPDPGAWVVALVAAGAGRRQGPTMPM